MRPDKKKIDYLNENTHHLVIDYTTDGETCAEVLCRLTPSVEDALIEVGVDKSWIDINQIKTKDGYDAICLTHAGFDKCGAKWWNPEFGFMTFKFE